MDAVTSTPSVQLIDQDLLDTALEQSEEAALLRAGQEERRVGDVKNVQREELLRLLGIQGRDGAALRGEMELPAEAEQRLEEDHQKRMTMVAAAPDAYVFKREDATAGVQDDSDRSIGIAHDVLDSPLVAMHEAEHRRQETGDQVATLPETGDAVIDAEDILQRRAMREDGAITAEGGVRHHTDEYRGFVRRADAIENYLNAAGEDGKGLRRKAALSNAGFAEMHDAMVRAAIRNRLRKTVLAG